MAFAKGKHYSILLQTEEGKNLIEKMADMSQKDFDEEVKKYLEKNQIEDVVEDDDFEKEEE